MKKMKAAIMAVVMAMIALAPMNVLQASAEDVKISNQEYDVYFSGKNNYFLCNRKTVGNKVGTEYFLTYTVEDVTSSGLQNGFLGTCAPEEEFPYIDGNGTLYYRQRQQETEEAPLLLKGYTYMIKFTVTESGFRYLASRAKDDSSEYVVIENKVAQGTPKESNYGYFGIWLGNGTTDAHLSHVRFYDAKGNDLGVCSPWSKITVTESGVKAKDTQVQHWYTITAKDLVNLAISNKYPLTTDKMYIEYTVAESESTCRQTGVALSNYPDITYPHSRGMLRYQGKDNEVDCLLLQPGADYFIELEKGEHGFTALVQITKDGKTTSMVFPSVSGVHDSNAQFFSLWFGQGGEWKSNFKLENVKFYDANRNNLGVQSNNSALNIRHHGAMLDYEACEAFYYCKEDGSFYELYRTQDMVYRKGDESVRGVYSIHENKITLESKQSTESCDYLFRGFTVSDGRYYERLYTYYVNFVAGNGSPIEKQVLNAGNGYLVTKPTEPTLKGCNFEGWVTSDGKEYDFDQVVTESKTVYAKWTNNAGVEYLAVAEDELQRIGTIPYIPMLISAVLLIATVTGSVFIIRGGKRNEKKEER